MSDEFEDEGEELSIWDDPEWKEFEAHVRKDALPKIESAHIFVSLAPSSADRVDIKYAVELGMAIMMDKPILVIAPPGFIVPEKLQKVADRIVYVDILSDNGKKIVASEIENFVTTLEFE